MRLVTKSLNILQKTTVYIGEVFLILMMGLMFVEVIYRFWGGSLLPFGHTILTAMVAWSVFLLIGSVSRENGHIRISFFIEKALGKRAERIWPVLEDVISLPLCVFLVWASWRWVALYMQQGLRQELFQLGGFTYPSWVPIIIVPIGLSIASVFYLERIVKRIHALFSHHGKEHELEKKDTNTEDKRLDITTTGSI
ncbi:TRAP transporter small permease [Chloroflexota bacterium]